MNFWGHLKTITRHRRLVRQYCFRLGLYRQGLTHDLSKYSPVEFWAGVKYFQGDHSPNDAQRKESGYSASWMHHKGRNRHHFEYWTDYSMDGSGISGVEMPKSMWRKCSATGWPPARSTGVRTSIPAIPTSFFSGAREKRLLMHPATEELLGTILIVLRDQGEDAAFDYVRREVLGKK